jgi:hypothetical protein
MLALVLVGLFVSLNVMDAAYGPYDFQMNQKLVRILKEAHEVKLGTATYQKNNLYIRLERTGAEDYSVAIQDGDTKYVLLVSIYSLNIKKNQGVVNSAKLSVINNNNVQNYLFVPDMKQGGYGLINWWYEKATMDENKLSEQESARLKLYYFLDKYEDDIRDVIEDYS